MQHIQVLLINGQEFTIGTRGLDKLYLIGWNLSLEMALVYNQVPPEPLSIPRLRIYEPGIDVKLNFHERALDEDEVVPPVYPPIIIAKDPGLKEDRREAVLSLDNLVTSTSN